MDTADEYRQNVEYCLRMARETRYNDVRDQWLPIPSGSRQFAASLRRDPAR